MSFLVHIKLFPLSNDEGQASITTRITWTLYALGLNMGLMVSMLYWVLEFDPSNGFPTYTQFMTHLGIFLLLLLDGMIINRNPIRIRQLFSFWLIALAFVIWSIIHGYSSLGNPEKNSGDEGNDDDAIYGVLNWKQRAGRAAILSVLVLFLAVPIIFHVLWAVSKLFKPRYLEEEENNNGGDDEDKKKEQEDEP